MLPARPSRFRTRRAALLVGALALGITACTADAPAPTPTMATPEPTLTVTHAATPTPTEEPNPAGLKPLPADEIDASFVTIENFFRAYEYGLRTGDPSALDTLSAPDCAACETLIGNIANVSELGDRARGGAFTIKISELKKSLVPGRIAWWLDVAQEPTSVTHSSGKKTTIKGFNGPVLVEVSTDDDFRITAFDTSTDD